MATRYLTGRAPLPCPKAISNEGHEILWRIVQRAVASTLDKSPEYFTPIGQRRAWRDITERICSAMAEEAKHLPRKAP